jgi:hypothetical protein
VDANIYIVESIQLFYSKENRETYNEIKNLKIMYSIVRLTLTTRARCLLMEYEQLDNLLEVVFKNKKQMKIVWW